MTNVPAPKRCPHCGKQRSNSFTATLPDNTLSTNTYAPPFVSAMGWNAIEPFLPAQFTHPAPLILTCEELCACTLEMLDEKLGKVTAERDALLTMQGFDATAQKLIQDGGGIGGRGISGKEAAGYDYRSDPLNPRNFNHLTVIVPKEHWDTLYGEIVQFVVDRFERSGFYNVLRHKHGIPQNSDYPMVIE